MRRANFTAAQAFNLAVGNHNANSDLINLEHDYTRGVFDRSPLHDIKNAIHVAAVNRSEPILRKLAIDQVNARIEAHNEDVLYAQIGEIRRARNEAHNTIVQGAAFAAGPLGLIATGVLTGDQIASGNFTALDAASFIAFRGKNRGVSRGEELRQKYGHLSSVQRRAIVADRTDALALKRLQNLEASVPGGHFLSRHGAQTSRTDQYLRSTQGILPDTGQVARYPNGNLKLVDSTRFLSHRDQFNQIERAMLINKRTGQRDVFIKNRNMIGEGFARRTGVYGVQYTSHTRFNSHGQTFTSYPKYGQ